MVDKSSRLERIVGLWLIGKNGRDAAWGCRYRESWKEEGKIDSFISCEY